MNVGIAIEETWSFLNEIFSDLSEHHNVSLFERREVSPPFFRERINRYLFRSAMQSFISANDVVFFEWASELLAYTSKLPKSCGIVTRLHRYEMYQWVNEINWDAVDKIILVTEAKRKEFISHFPEQQNKVVVIPEAVSFKTFKFFPKTYRGDIGILCHLTPRKRVYELILAFFDLIQLVDGFHLHIGGGKHILFGDYYESMHALVQKLGLEKKVTFYEHVKDPQSWYNDIDIFISNSYSEGLQVALIEAMASGCYCLSHCWDGVDELLPQENLYFTNGQLNEKILGYSDLPDVERSAIRKSMRQIAQNNCDIDIRKNQIRQLIEVVGELWSQG